MEVSKYGDYGPLMLAKIKTNLIKQVKGYVYVHFIEEDDQFDWVVVISNRHIQMDFEYKKKDTNVDEFSADAFVKEVVSTYRHWLIRRFFKEDNNGYISRKKDLLNEPVSGFFKVARESEEHEGSSSSCNLQEYEAKRDGLK